MIIALIVFAAIISLFNGLNYYKKDDSFAMSIIRDFSIYSLLSPFLIWYLSSIWLGLLCLVINFMFFSYSYNIASKNNNKF